MLRAATLRHQRGYAGANRERPLGDPLLSGHYGYRLYISIVIICFHKPISGRSISAVALSQNVRALPRVSRYTWITATPLVKELIAGLFSEDYARPSQRKIALLLLEILSEAPPLTMALPMPNDERLFSAARSLLVNQRWEASLSELAFMSAMSERTFSRLFMKDTGFSFRTWKQRARICASLDLLANGVPIKQVAYQLGFSCPAAFTAAFRCILGATPRDFVP